MAKKKGFLDGYKTYDTSAGYGGPKQWRRAFNTRMGKDDAAQIMAADKDTPHGILGISPQASQTEIKAAFRRLIAEWHPDKNPHRLTEAEEMSKRIIAAYTVLKG